MLAVAEAFVDYLKSKLNIPVSISKQTGTHQVHRRLKNGSTITYNRTTKRNVIKRSVRGEFPRKETGSLQASLSFKVRVSGTNVYATVGFLRNVLMPYPPGHPGHGKWQKSRPPSLYSMILEFRMARRLLIDAWRMANQSGVIRRAVEQKGFKYFPGTEKMIKFPSFMSRDAAGELQPIPAMQRWMPVEQRAIEDKFYSYSLFSGEAPGRGGEDEF